MILEVLGLPWFSICGEIVGSGVQVPGRRRERPLDMVWIGQRPKWAWMAMSKFSPTISIARSQACTTMFTFGCRIRKSSATEPVLFLNSW